MKYFINSVKKIIEIKILLLSLVLIIISVYIFKFLHKKITAKTIYVGCLYSNAGQTGSASHNNYEMLLESFKYAVKKYDCNLNIIPIYKNLDENLESYSNWVIECVKKYNIKYFFGCWKSTERKHLLPILKKYNLRLFYPIQYEGFECSKNVYYFGGTPNQQLFPALKFMFDAFYFYEDVYVVGSNFLYPKFSAKLIDYFITQNKKTYNKKLVYTKIFDENTKDFSEFIDILFKKSPNGAIIINLINGDSYFEFYKQLNERYDRYFPQFNKKIITDNTLFLETFKQNVKEPHIELQHRFPSISLRMGENRLKPEYFPYLKNNLFCFNFADKVITDPVYQIFDGYDKSAMDLKFLNNLKIKNKNKAFGDSQYNTFISALFFVKTLKKIMTNNENIYDPDIYSKNSNIFVISACGDHIMRPNNHITKNFYILFLDQGKFDIQYQNLKNILPDPYMGITDKIFFCEAENEKLYMSDRIYL